MEEEEGGDVSFDSSSCIVRRVLPSLPSMLLPLGIAPLIITTLLHLLCRMASAPDASSSSSCFSPVVRRRR